MGLEVKEWREKKSISQQELANKMKLSLTAYRNKESGRSKFYFDEIIKIAKIVELDQKDWAELYKNF